MCPILRGKMGLDTPPALTGAGVRNGRGGRSPPTRGGSRWAERRACRGVYWGLRPLAFWGGLSCGLAALYFGTYGARQLFPLETYRPALRAGVGEFGGRGSAAFGATGDSGADCKLSGASEAFRLRHAGSRKRQLAPPMRTKSVFLWGATPVSLGKTKEMGWHVGLAGASPCLFYASAMTSTSQSMFFGRVLTATQLRAGLPVK